jgi:hypothetical protein
VLLVGLLFGLLFGGESFKYTFRREGEYFFNDCTDPRPTGKVVVYQVPQDIPGALEFVDRALSLGTGPGFMRLTGNVTARFRIPNGYTLDGDIKLKTPLSETLVTPSTWHVTPNGKTLVAKFRRADLENNVPAGDAVPLMLSANFMNAGVQKQLTSSANVRVLK